MMYGTPPMWDRPAGFGTLLNIILEQQVSLASAKACFDKLTAHLGEVGDRLTIMSYTFVDEALAKKWEPHVIVMGENGAIAQERGI